MRTPTDITVRELIPTEEIMGVVTPLILAHQPLAEEIEVETIGLAEGVDGFYLVERDGCCYGPLMDTRVLEFWYRVPSDRTTPDGKPMHYLMHQNYSMPVAYIHQMATGEPVNLSEWIKPFGQRIENNYEICRTRLEKGDVAGRQAHNQLAPAWAKETD